MPYYSNNSPGEAAFIGAAPVLARGLMDYKRMRQSEASMAAQRAYEDAVRQESRQYQQDQERRRYEQEAQDAAQARQSKEELTTAQGEQAMHNFEMSNPDLINYGRDVNRPLTFSEIQGVRGDRQKRTDKANERQGMLDLADQYGGPNADFARDTIKATGRLPSGFEEQAMREPSTGRLGHATANDPEYRYRANKKKILEDQLKQITDEANVVEVGKHGYTERKQRVPRIPAFAPQVEELRRQMDEEDKGMLTRMNSLINPDQGPGTIGNAGAPRAQSAAARGAGGQPLQNRMADWQPQDEQDFQAWYQHWRNLGIDVPANPDAPGNMDFRSAFAANRRPQQQQVPQGPVPSGPFQQSMRFPGDDRMGAGFTPNIPSTSQGPMAPPQMQQAQPMQQSPQSAAPMQQAQPQQIRSVKVSEVSHLPRVGSEEDYAQLPPGTTYLDIEDGVVRLKGGSQPSQRMMP